MAGRSSKEGRTEPAMHHQRARSLGSNGLALDVMPVEHTERSTPRYMDHVLSRFGHHLSAREWSLFSQSMVPMLQSSSPGSTQQRTAATSTTTTTSAGISLPRQSTQDISRSVSTPSPTTAPVCRQSQLHQYQYQQHRRIDFHKHRHPPPSSQTPASMDWSPKGAHARSAAGGTTLPRKYTASDSRISDISHIQQ